MSDDRCPRCGSLYSLVGRSHLCGGTSQQWTQDEIASFDQRRRPVVTVDAAACPPSYARSRYRDVERRRSYMRDYMRKRRARL